MKVFKKVGFVLLCLSLVFTLTACGTTPPEETPEAPKKTDIKIAISAAVTDLNPGNWYLGTQSAIFDNVYSTLIDIAVDQDGVISLRGDLAKDWTVSDDLLTWTFNLNENAVFSNGDPVTSQHVKECFERNLENPYTSYNVDMISAIEIPNDNTVEFVLHQPSKSVPYTWYMIAVYNTELYDANPEAYSAAPVASGPYNLTMVDSATGNYTLELKEEWWGDTKPTIETVHLTAIKDPSTLVVAIEGGEVDFGLLSGTNLLLAEQNDKLVMKENIVFAGAQLILNQTVEPLNNPLLRQAIGYALNYESLHTAIGAGFISSRDTTLRFATMDYDIPEDIKQFEYNPEKARELLAESGLTTPLDLGTIIGGETDGSAELIKQYLSEIGITVQIASMDPNTRVSKLLGGDFQLAISGSPGYLSAAETLQRLYGTGELYNFSKYSNQEIDEIAAEMQMTSERAEYEALAKRALEILAEDVPVFGIGMSASYSVANKDLDFSPTWSSLDLVKAFWK